MAALSIFISGCSNSEQSATKNNKVSVTPIANKNPNLSKLRPSTITQAPDKATTTSSSVPANDQSPFDFLTYESNPVRYARIQPIVNKFGEMVVQQMSITGSPWAPFKTQCRSGQYLVEPFDNASGENCYIIHSPEFGGSQTEITTDVTVGPDGAYTNRFNIAGYGGSNCYAVFLYNSPTGWSVSDSKIPSSATNTDKAQSYAQAEIIDNTAIACLEQAHP